ncbi:MAG: 1-deoxy-D-xylulose-5-phosphate reductoisomerase [Calditrichia bacterium]
MTAKKQFKNIALLGSTGSIGENSLDVIRQHPDHFKAFYLSGHRNIQKLAEQAREFKPKAAVVTDAESAETAKTLLKEVCPVYHGPDAVLKIVEDPDVDLVLNALVGGVGVVPTYYAIKAGKDIALANKETLVMAGQLITSTAREQGVHIFPIDSEHSAIWQCLLGEDPDSVRRILLTASGGPFRTWPPEKLHDVTAKQALIHPNWQMGAKITIDSATLMNKGLEIIEAYWLYSVPLSRIEVVVHPQSIIHSMVEFEDGSIKAQLGIPDMRIPIQYALTYPKRLPLQVENISFKNLKSLTFEEPDFNKFPCLRIAIEAMEKGGTAPAVMNTANEVAVGRFLKGEIGFMDIPRIIEKTLEAHDHQETYILDDLLKIESRTREFSATL